MLNFVFGMFVIIFFLGRRGTLAVFGKTGRFVFMSIIYHFFAEVLTVCDLKSIVHFEIYVIYR